VPQMPPRDDLPVSMSHAAGCMAIIP